MTGRGRRQGAGRGDGHALAALPEVPQEARPMRWRWRSLAAYSATQRCAAVAAGRRRQGRKAWEAFVKERKT